MAVAMALALAQEAYMFSCHQCELAIRSIEGSLGSELPAPVPRVFGRSVLDT